MGIIVIIIILFGLFFFLKNYKSIKVGSIALFNGGVKTGKTTLAVNVALKEYKKALFRYKVRRLFGAKDEKPLLYSNIPLSVPYVPVTRELLLREIRPAYKSVILLSEASLVADSQLIKDKVINQQLLEFFKLIGHETRGGKVIIDTQCVSDLHYSIKRCLSEFVYIHHIIKWIPFFIFAYVREERYSEDLNIVNAYNEDIEDSLKRVIISKRTWKKFDCYCYSAITDGLSVEKTERRTNNLKISDYVSFREKLKIKR